MPSPLIATVPLAHDNDPVFVHAHRTEGRP